MRINPNSFAFTLLLGLLATLPTFGIDMILPTLSATGAALGASPSEVGLTMSVYLLSLGAALSIYGPVSDRFGRKPVVVFGCLLVITASIGCALAQSLPALLAWRVVQGAGAAGMMPMAIVRDLFDGKAARAKMSYVVIAVNVVPMISPTVGAALLALGGWRIVYLVFLGAACVLLLAMSLGFAESAKIDPANRLMPSVIARNYLRVLTHRACLGYILVNAAGAGAVFAYITGSSLFFMNVMGLRPDQYGLIFGASSIAVMGGAFLDGRFSAWGASPGHVLTIGLTLSSVAATLLLTVSLAGWTPIPLVMSVMIVVALSFGLISPNAMNGAMQPLPQIAGFVSAAAICLQMTAAAGSSALVTVLFDGHSALSMAAFMMLFSLLSVISYLFVARPSEPFTVSAQTDRR